MCSGIYPRRWSLLGAKGPRQRVTTYLALWPQEYCSISLRQYLIYKAGDEATILDDSITELSSLLGCHTSPPNPLSSQPHSKAAATHLQPHPCNHTDDLEPRTSPPLTADPRHYP